MSLEVDDAESSTESLGEPGADAFLANLMGEPPAATEADDDAPEADAKELEDADDDTPEADPEPTEADPDDAEVDLGSDQKAKLRDLKAAYGERAASVAASAAAETVRAEAVTAAARASATMDAALARAKARWEPFSKLDFLDLSRDTSISQADFTAVRKEANEALQDLRFLTEEVDSAVKATQAAATERSNATAQATVKALSDPSSGIPNWSPALYQEMLQYADQNGAPKGVPQAMVAEWALRALHKAMLYDRGVASTTSKMAKVVAKPTRVLQGKSATPSTGSTTKSAMAALRRSGSVDDAADAFFASVTN